MKPFDTRSSPRLIAGPGRLAELPAAVRALGGSHALIITDPGIVAAGHAQRAHDFLTAADITYTTYENSRENPTESDAEQCHQFARQSAPDVLIGLGGGSSMDTAKACNFLLHHGGRMADFKGYGHATQPMLPFIAIPTTTGTGSECQSFALVSHDDTHEKMACGDPKALAQIALLDPELTYSQPQKVATLTAIDALSHALESAVSNVRNPLSSAYSRSAFQSIAPHIAAIISGQHPSENPPHDAMQIGAALAGLAIENSMLGAAHALANPLTAQLGLPHGHAIALMLPSVLAFNAHDPATAAIYDDFQHILGQALIPWVEQTIALAKLAQPDISPSDIPQLAADAARQWTGKFNPVPVDEASLTQLYRTALQPNDQ